MHGIWTGFNQELDALDFERFWQNLFIVGITNIVGITDSLEGNANQNTMRCHFIHIRMAAI